MQQLAGTKVLYCTAPVAFTSSHAQAVLTTQADDLFRRLARDQEELMTCMYHKACQEL